MSSTVRCAVSKCEVSISRTCQSPLCQLFRNLPLRPKASQLCVDKLATDCRSDWCSRHSRVSKVPIHSKSVHVRVAVWPRTDGTRCAGGMNCEARAVGGMGGAQIGPCSDLWDADGVRECGCCHGKHAHCEDKSDDLASTKPMSRDEVLSSKSTMAESFSRRCSDNERSCRSPD